MKRTHIPLCEELETIQLVNLVIWNLKAWVIGRLVGMQVGLLGRYADR